MHSCLESHPKHSTRLCDLAEGVSQSPAPESGQAESRILPGGPPPCKSLLWGIAQADHTQYPCVLWNFWNFPRPGHRATASQRAACTLLPAWSPPFGHLTTDVGMCARCPGAVSFPTCPGGADARRQDRGRGLDTHPGCFPRREISALGRRTASSRHPSAKIWPPVSGMVVYINYWEM